MSPLRRTLLWVLSAELFEVSVQVVSEFTFHCILERLVNDSVALLHNVCLGNRFGAICRLTLRFSLLASSKKLRICDEVIVPK